MLWDIFLHKLTSINQQVTHNSNQSTLTERMKSNGKLLLLYLDSSGVSNYSVLSLIMPLLSVSQLGTSLLIMIQEVTLVCSEDFGGLSDTTSAHWLSEASFLPSFGLSESSLSTLIRN